MLKFGYGMVLDDLPDIPEFHFFLGSGVWTPPDPIKFKCCIHILEILESLEIHMSGSHHLMGQFKMCHLKAEKNELNHSGCCLLSQILFHCFVCLCICIFFLFYYPTLSLLCMFQSYNDNIFCGWTSSWCLI